MSREIVMNFGRVRRLAITIASIGALLLALQSLILPPIICNKNCLFSAT